MHLQLKAALRFRNDNNKHTVMFRTSKVKSIKDIAEYSVDNMSVLRKVKFD